MAGRAFARRPVVQIRDGRARRRRDVLAAEEPMELRVNGEAVAVTMRTPGHDFELALGFCLSEGVVERADEVQAIRYCADAPSPYRGDFNVVDVRLRSPDPVAASLRRNVYTTSSCGVCGTASIDAVRGRGVDVSGDPLRVSVELLAGLPGKLRRAQAVFERTGGLHAAALFDGGGTLCCLREDVGRHNAVDKVIGWAATGRALPLTGHILMVSGRVAFEIAQKAVLAGVPVLAAVSAPSSLAVALAEDSGMTLVGFLRGPTMNLYAADWRVLG